MDGLSVGGVCTPAREPNEHHGFISEVRNPFICVCTGFTAKTLHQPTLLFPRVKLNFFHRFSGAYYDSAISFFLTRQVSEIILNESSKSTKNAPIE
jgi:hypothetical protein